MMSKSSLTIKNTLANLFANKDYSEVISGTVVTMALKVVGLGLTYGFIYLLARYWGPRIVGIYTLSITVLFIGGKIGAAGFNNSILRFSAQYGLGGKDGVLRSIYNRMFLFALFFSIIPAIFVYAAADYLSIILLKEPGLGTTFRVVAAAIPLMALGLINTEAVRGLKKIKECEFFRTVNPGFWNMALFFSAVFFIGFNPALPVMTYAIALLITFVLSTWLFLSQTGGGARAGASASVRNMEIFSVSLPVFITTLMTLVMDHAAILALGYLGTAEQVGVYTVAERLSVLTSVVLISINSIVAPKFAELYWSGKKDDLKKVIRFSSKSIFWASAPVLLVFLIFPAFFMGIFGEGFRSGWLALVVLSIGQFINSACGSVGYFLMMTNGQRALMIIILLAGALNIALCVMLIPAIGFVGAAVATASTLVFWNITAVLYIKFKYGISTFYLPLLKPN